MPPPPRAVAWPWNAAVAAGALAAGGAALLAAAARLRALAVRDAAAALGAGADAEAAAVEARAAVEALARLPRGVADVRAAQAAARALAERHFAEVLAAFSLVYVFKQTFSVPGAAVLNVLSGALWGFALGWPLACVLTACGASLCFLLSRTCAAEMAARAGPDSTGRFARALFKLRAKVREVHEEEGPVALTLYLASLRMVPVTPQWLLNVVLPHADVPLPIFFASILLGLLPYNFVTVSAGSMLGSIESTSDLFDAQLILKMAAAALTLASLPALARRLSPSRSSPPGPATTRAKAD